MTSSTQRLPPSSLPRADWPRAHSQAFREQPPRRSTASDAALRTQGPSLAHGTIAIKDKFSVEPHGQMLGAPRRGSAGCATRTPSYPLPSAPGGSEDGRLRESHRERRAAQPDPACGFSRTGSATSTARRGYDNITRRTNRMPNSRRLRRPGPGSHQPHQPHCARPAV